MITLFDDQDLIRFAEPLNELFRKLEDLDREDDVIIMQIVHGQHSVKKLATRLVEFNRTEEGRFDYRPMASLMQTVLRKNYTYWLAEEDPQLWFG